MKSLSKILKRFISMITLIVLLKNPVVAEFLGLAQNTDFTESDLESFGLIAIRI